MCCRLCEAGTNPTVLTDPDDRCGRLGNTHVHDPVIDEWLCLSAPLIFQTHIPGRHQTLYIQLADLLERTVAMQPIAHPVGEISRMIAATVRFARQISYARSTLVRSYPDHNDRI